MIQFSLTDLQNPEMLERILRQIANSVDAIPAPPAQPSLSSLALQLAPLISKELQANGSAPLNLQSLIGLISGLTTGDFIIAGGPATLKDSGFSVVPAISGGTGLSSFTIGDLIYATTTTTLGRLTDAALGNVLLSGGVGSTPSYGKVDLTAAVTGVLPTANGGTGVSYNRIADTRTFVNQSADITSTNFANVVTPGLYRVSYALEDTAADVTAGAVTLTIAYTADAGSITIPSAAQLLTGLGLTQGTIFVQATSGNISFSTSHTGIFGSAKYALYLVLERLS